MATNRTFTMLKPDSVEKGNIGAILEKITASGFRIAALKLTQMTVADAQARQFLLENPSGEDGSAGLIDAGGAAGENNALGV